MDKEELQALMKHLHGVLQTPFPTEEGYYYLTINNKERHALLTALEIAGEL